MLKRLCELLHGSAPKKQENVGSMNWYHSLPLNLVGKLKYLVNWFQLGVAGF